MKSKTNIDAVSDNLEFANLLKDTEIPPVLFNSNKYAVSLYQHIQKHSTLQHADSGNLYNPHRTHHDISHLTREDLFDLLKKLVSHRAILSLPVFSYNYKDTNIDVVPAFIAVPNNSIHTPEFLVNVSIQTSAKAFDIYLSNRKPLTRDDIYDELLKEFDSDRRPVPIKFNNVNIQSLIESANFDIPISEEIIRTFIKGIIEQLEKTERAVYIPRRGVVPLRHDELLLRFETHVDFFQNKTIPFYSTNSPAVKNKIEKLNIEDEILYIESEKETKPKSAKKYADQARAIRDAKPKNIESDTYPASLNIDMIIALEVYAQKLYDQKLYEEYRKKAYEIKKTLTTLGYEWSLLIRFIFPEDKKSMGEETFNLLLSDTDLIHTTWELDGARTILLTSKDPAVFPLIVRGMLDLDQKERWKILALKQLMDDHDESLKSIFKNDAFKNNYGKLLHRAYIEHMSWFLQILFVLPFKFLNDYFFKLAKQKIKEKQKQLQSGNIQKEKRDQIAQEVLRKKRLQQLQEYRFKQIIIDTLDHFYIERKIIPLKSEVKFKVLEMDTSTFNRIITDEKFSVLKNSKASDLYDKHDGIIFYPSDTWNMKSNEVIPLLEKILKTPDDGQVDPIFLSEQKSRAAKIKYHLNRKFISNTIHKASQKNTEDDPYKIFEKQLDAIKGKEDNRASSSYSDDDF